MGLLKLHPNCKRLTAPHLGRTLATILGAVPIVVGCKSEAVRNCQQQFQNAQITVQEKSAQPDGLDPSIAAVDLALTACRAVNRQDEVRELQTARTALANHLERVKQHASRPKRKKLSPNEIDELVRSGDSECPRGMAYNIEGTDRTVKCVGLLPVRMNWDKAVEYYSKRGYRVVTTDSPPSVRAEHGAELNVFVFAKRGDPSPPKCLTVYPEPTVPWQEAVARVTGVTLPKIKSGSPLPTPDGKLPMRIDEGKDKLVIHLGDCE